jgi:hypothetical protein
LEQTPLSTYSFQPTHKTAVKHLPSRPSNPFQSTYFKEIEMLENVNGDGLVNMSLSKSYAQSVSLCFDGVWFMAVIKGYRKVYMNPEYCY